MISTKIVQFLIPAWGYASFYDACGNSAHDTLIKHVIKTLFYLYVTRTFKGSERHVSGWSVPVI